MGEDIPMRHRISTVLGSNSTKFDLDNTGEVKKELADLAIKTYFGYWEGFDFKVMKNRVDLGVEPSYQYDNLVVVSINKRKGRSFIKTGRAFGGYGSGVRSRTLKYADYKYNSKFVKFVDEAHKILFGGSK